MDLKQPFENEQILKQQKNGDWIIFQYSPFASSSINKRILYTTRNKNKAETAFILLKVWQEIIQS